MFVLILKSLCQKTETCPCYAVDFLVYKCQDKKDAIKDVKQMNET